MQSADLPQLQPTGHQYIAASLISFGSDEQKHRWAVPVLKGEKTASLGMSEPSAGSDLASLRTRAVRDGDDFVVNGQKVWTSGAHDADFLLTFVRTDPDAPKHKGISVLIIPTDLPGVVCRPFASICGVDDEDFNEVFFTDVRVPAENLVGPRGGGWGVANGSLGHERTMMWLGFADRIANMIGDFTPVTPFRKDQYASMIMDYQALRLMGSSRAGQGRARRIRRGIGFGGQAVRIRSRAAGVRIRACGSGFRRSGASVQHGAVRAHESGPLLRQLVRASRAKLLGNDRRGYLGVQRNIIAQQVLGLPRGK